MRLFLYLSFLIFVHAQQWCGKNYLPTQPIVPPSHRFPYPQQSSEPLLAFQCTPAVTPYTSQDSFASIIIDAKPTIYKLPGTVPTSNFPNLINIVVKVDEYIVALQNEVSLDSSSAHEVIFDLSLFPTQHEPYTLGCEVNDIHGATIVQSSTHLWIVPKPAIGSVVTRDARTGALLVGPNNTGQYTPIFPVGFFTSFGGYLESDEEGLSHLKEIKTLGFNLVHPVPPYVEVGIMKRVLQDMQDLGLYLMYDMRHTYQDAASVRQEAELVKQYSNLLLWYTADEPDGHGHSFDAPARAYSLIRQPDMDGFDHPISISLNCRDFGFMEYVSGADILLVDPYVVGIDAQWSRRFQTPCTKDYGCCGCDECEGKWEDIITRLEEVKWRLAHSQMDWERRKSVWLVPQAFGCEEHWSRVPTGQEWLLQASIGLNHGVTGIVSWLYPTTTDIKSAASLLAKSLPELSTNFLLNYRAQFAHFDKFGRLDIGPWSMQPTNSSFSSERDLAVLVIVANLASYGGTTSVEALDIHDILPGCSRSNTIGWDIKFSLGLHIKDLAHKYPDSLHRQRFELAVQPLGSGGIVFFCQFTEHPSMKSTDDGKHRTSSEQWLKGMSVGKRTDEL